MQVLQYAAGVIAHRKQSGFFGQEDKQSVLLQINNPGNEVNVPGIERKRDLAVS